LTTAESLRHNTYNVSSGRSASHRDLVVALHAITPDPRSDVPPARQVSHGNDSYLDITRLTRDTGFAPRFDLVAALADYVAWRTVNPR
jgi:nucleoside-diphosphate-sugar epimerase